MARVLIANYLTFGLSPGDLGKDWRKKMQITRKCRKEGSFAFIAFRGKQVHANPHQGCACAGCPKCNYSPPCGLAGLHSPPSVTFVSKLLCFQVNIMGLQPNALPSSHWSLVWNKCEHCLINPPCGPWREVASNIPSIFAVEEGKAKQIAHFKFVPSLLDISIWISCWFVKLNLPQIELIRSCFLKYITLSERCVLVNGTTSPTILWVIFDFSHFPESIIYEVCLLPPWSSF